MAIVKMKKAHIIALQSEKQEIVKKLQKFGGLHIVNLEEQIAEEKHLELTVDSDNDKVSQLEARLSQVKYSLDFLNKYDTKKSNNQQRIQITEAEYQEYLNNEDGLNSTFNQCRDIDFKFNELKNRETKLVNQIQQLQPWSPLKVGIEAIRPTKNTNSAIGYILSKFAEDFKNEISNLGELTYYEEVNSNRENTYILMIYHKDIEDTVSQIEKQFGWSRISFNDLSGTAQQNIDKLNAEIETMKQERADLNNNAKELLQHKNYLETLQDVLTVERDKASVINNFAKTEQTFMLSGWVPVKMQDKLKEALDEVTQNYSLTIEDPKEDEEPPVLLNNVAFAQPAEFVTEQYSLPHPYGIDPNLIMTPFYIMFFGMMVSDAVYGILLSVITGVVLLTLKPQGGLKKIMGLLFMGGLSTWFWGAAFGGWLGGFIPIKPFLFDPLKEPFMMLGLCLALGVVHLYVGIGIQAYKNIRSGNIMDAVFDQGFWYALLTGLMMLAWGPTAVIGKYLALTGTAGMVLFAGRAHKNPVRRLMSGVLSLYNVTGFLGDVLSYLRLFALGLATGVIGTVVNSMSAMMGGTFIGYILMTFFMILGHTFNMGINVLGAYVHSSRLQYVEFFGKFYDGDGKPFNPFRIKTKHIQQ